MFEFDGDEYTLEELQGYAKQQNMDFETYLKELKSLGLKEKQSQTMYPWSGSQFVSGTDRLVSSNEPKFMSTVKDGQFVDLYDSYSDTVIQSSDLGLQEPRVLTDEQEELKTFLEKEYTRPTNEFGYTRPAFWYENYSDSEDGKKHANRIYSMTSDGYHFNQSEDDGVKHLENSLKRAGLFNEFEVEATGGIFTHRITVTHRATGYKREFNAQLDGDQGKKEFKRFQDWAANPKETQGERQKRKYYEAGGILPEWWLETSTMLADNVLGLVQGTMYTVESEKIAKGLAEGKTVDELVEEGEIWAGHAAFDMVRGDLNKFQDPHFNEDGSQANVVDLIEQGKYADAGNLASSQAVSNIYSFVISAVNPLAGAGVIATSSYGENFKDNIDRRLDPANITEEDLNDLRFNSLYKAGAEFVGEYLGARMFRGVVGLSRKGTTEEVVKEYSRGFVERGLRGFLGGFSSEFVAEGITNNLQQAADQGVYGDEKEFKDYFRGFINDGLIGGLLGGPISGGMRATNATYKNDIYKILAPKKWQSEMYDLNLRILNAKEEINNATGRTREIYQERLDRLEQMKAAKERQLIATFDNKTDTEMLEYAKKIDRINKLFDIYTDRKQSIPTRKDARKEISDLYNELNQDTDGFIDVDTEVQIGKVLKARELLDSRKGIRGFGKDLVIKYLDTDAEVEAAIKESGESGLSKADGMFMGVNADGKSTIYINTRVASMTGATNVLGHELLHYIFSKNFKTDNASMKPLVDSFKKYLVESGNSAFLKRIEDRMRTQGYFDQDGNIKENYLEEYFQMFSDLIEKNKIKLNEDSKGTKSLTKAFTDKFVALGLKSVKLETGKDVFDFLRLYTKNVNRKGLLGSITKRTITRVQLESSKVAKADGKKKKAFSMSKDATDAINEIGRMGWNSETWKTQGSDYAIKTLQEERMLDALIRSKYKADVVPENFVDLVYSELVGHIKNFNPEKNDNLFGWINSQIANKAGNVYNREFKKKEQEKTAKDVDSRTKEGDVKVQVAAEKDTRIEAFEEQDLSPAARAQRKTDTKEEKTSKFRNKLGIKTGSDLYNKILDAATKSLLRAYQAGTSVRNIQRKLRDEANLYLFKDIKNFLGAKEYIKNLKEFRVPIIDAMFTADLVQMERNLPNNERVFTKFVRKLTTIEDVQSAIDQNLLPPSAINIIKKGTAVSLYKKVMPTQEQFLGFFDIPTINPKTGARSGKRGTRKDALAKAIAGSLSFDATMQVAQSTEVVNKRAEIAALKGETLAQDNIEQLAAEIGRDPNVKFSYTNDAQTNSYIDKGLYNLLINVKDTKGMSYRVALKELINSNIYSIEKLKNIPEIRQSLNEQILLRQKEGLKSKPTSYYLEQHVINNFASLSNNNAFINLVLDQVAEGVNPDVSLEIDGMTLGVEVKADTGRGPARTVYLDIDGIINGDINIAGNKESLNPEKIEQLIKKTIPALKKIKKLLSEEFKIKKFNLSSARGESQTLIPEAAWKRIKKQRLDAEIASFVFVDSDFVNFDYLNKEIPSFYINMGNAGLFTTTTFDPLKTGASNFAGVPIPLTVRVVASKPSAQPGMRRLSLKVETQLDSKTFPKQPINLFKQNDVNKIGNKFSKSSQSGVSTLNKAIKFSRSSKNKTKGITVLDFDDTLATTKSMINFTRPDGTTGKLNAEQYASTYEDLLDKGYKFDFSEFSKVVKGKTAPLFNKAMKLQSKFGPKNMFVLTARPADSAPAIRDFLKSKGLNIPLKNITGLANSTAESKALWIANKVAEGYNDFYFADDALQNVQAVKNMLDQFDVKSKVQQAKTKFSNSMNTEFNKILEQVTGIEAIKRFSDAKARRRGKRKGMFRIFVPPSHEDFIGLLYNFMGKGELGNKHREFFENALIKPLNRAYRELNRAKQAIANDYKSLLKSMPQVKNVLTKEILDGDFTTEDAIRVYLWNKAGFEIPGLSKTDQKQLVDYIKNDSDLLTFAEAVGKISRIEEGYTTPGDIWDTGNIKYDLVDATGRVGRIKFFKDFIENSDIIFSKENMNKIRAAFGDNFVEALEDMLYRVKNGTNRPAGKNKQVNAWLDWINGSVGATMFFNIRSAILQQISFVNFINFADNNIFAAAKAFANQKQFWQDFSFIFNSSFLKQRRSGASFDVNASEIAREVSRSKNPVRAAIKYILNLGFLPTQMGDSFAIAVGGASFLRNRINTYLKQGLSKTEAETKAFNDFMEVAESTQQSARPDMLSMQQTSVLGRLILAFQNVTSQYVRLIKKSGLDLINRRKSPPYTTQAQSDKANISKIIYYGAVQSIIFYGLQSAVLAALMEDEDEKSEKILKTKKDRILQGTIDSILKGSGVGGAVISTLKNYAIKLEENAKSKEFFKTPAWEELLQLSPPIGIKIRKLRSAERSLQWNKDAAKLMSKFDLDNPTYEISTQVVEALTNVPLARLHRKLQNIHAGLDSENKWWQRVAVLSGWSRWDVGIEKETLKEAKEESKRIKNEKNKLKNKEKSKKEQKRKNLLDIGDNEPVIEKETKKKKKKKKIRMLDID